MSILVLGIGNILLSDEGIGPHVIARLQDRYDLPDSIRAVDGGTSGMDLLNTLAGHDRLLIVDCAELGAEPGTVRELTGQAVPSFFSQRISPHQIGLSDLLAAARLVDLLPGELALIAVQPASTELSLTLSEVGQVAAAQALDRLIDRLAAWGHSVRLREAA